MVGNPMAVIILIVQTKISGIIGIWKWISIINEKGTMEYYIPSHLIIFNMDLLNTISHIKSSSMKINVAQYQQETKEKREKRNKNQK